MVRSQEQEAGRTLSQSCFAQLALHLPVSPASILDA